MNTHGHRKCYLIKKLALSLCVGFYSLCMAVVADDTEIYFGYSGTVVSSVNPNILFILDTSSSMKDIVPGTGISRLNNMKQSLRSLIGRAENVNMGLMRFSNFGGPVLYPVTSLDKTINNVSNVEVVSRISSSFDDAYMTSAGVVELTDQTVSLTTGLGLVGIVEETLILDDGKNDAEESLSDTYYSHNSSDLELTKDTYQTRGEQLIGLRFNQTPLLSTSTIVSAHLEFSKKNQGGDTEPLSISIKGEKGGDSGWFDVNNNGISDRTLTDAVSDWNVGNFDSDGKLISSDLGNVISEIIEDPNWRTGEGESALTFVMQRSSGDGNRVALSANNGSTAVKPKLHLKYTNLPVASEHQTVGLRFQNVAIPAGATITSAVLEFVADQTSPAEATTFVIKAQDSGNAEPFTQAINDLNRTPVASTVIWDENQWSSVGSVEQSVDISTVVQDVVNNTQWCGNNAMAIFISNTGRRVAKSFDADPSLAPTLRITYDPTTIPVSGGCFVNEKTYGVSSKYDDAEENNNGKSFNFDSSDLELIDDGGGDTSEVGIRFNGIQLAQGVQIESAYLEFTAKDSTSAPTSLTIYGHDTDNSPAFASGVDTVTNRPKTTSVTWGNVEEWVAEGKYRSPDITPIVQEIVNKDLWFTGNSMAFIFGGVGLRRAYAFNTDISNKAPRLVIRSRGMSKGERTARDEMLTIVDEMQMKEGTSIVDTYYEAVKYFRGEEVLYGARRGEDSTDLRQNTRVSHIDSWDDSAIGDQLYRPENCSTSNLNSLECIDEVITGSPNYISPITESCQKNHIVILTDGAASSNDAEARIKNLLGISNCEQLDIPPGSSPDDLKEWEKLRDAQACGPELAKWLNNVDQVTATGFDGDQTITTHTIGFNFTGDWIKSLSDVGGGGSYTASTSSELSSVFTEIFNQATRDDATFVSGTLGVNPFNPLNHFSDIYYSVFKPTAKARWEGNVKKYHLGGSDNEIRGENDLVAVDPDTGFFNDSARSYWLGGDEADGAEVSKGGVVKHLPSYDNRLTYTDVAVDYSTLGNNTSVSLRGDALYAVSSANTEISVGDLGDASMSADDRDKLLRWIGGEDVQDEDGDPSTLTHQLFSDPLHSKPIVLTHGGTEFSPEQTIFFGSNDGHFRAVNAVSGVQRWSFIPSSLLPVSKILYDNNTIEHPYGVDGPLLLWVNDTDFDGTQVTFNKGNGEFAYIYFGMRRGGRAYYGFDVTDVDDPEIMWKIEGGMTPGFERLAQSWSRPVRTKVSVKNGGSRDVIDVLIFAGGYDDDQDDAQERTTDDLGGDLFIVNAKTGELLWKASDGNHEGIMNYSMPASPAVADYNRDGLADQIYIGDMGGQVWRFDIDNEAANTDDLARGGIIADLAQNGVDGNGMASDARRIYHTPELTSFKDENGDRQINVLVGTGFHAHPLETQTQDRFYNIILPTAYTYTAVPSADYNDTTIFPVTEAMLYDATSNDLGEGSAAQKTFALEALANASGWYITMTNTGEKVLSSPSAIEGKAIFTTYQPAATNTGCAIDPGTTREYVIQIKDATPAFDLNNNNAEELTQADRGRDLKTSNIVDQPTVPYTEEGGASTKIGTEDGTNPFGSSQVIKTFWYQEK